MEPRLNEQKSTVNQMKIAPAKTNEMRAVLQLSKEFEVH